MTKPTFNFEKSYKEIEKIVEQFESGDIDLDQSLKEFERGLKLAEQLKAKLSEVENKVIEIKNKFNSEV
jgi:exodeoxyribonuclease VII small subunit